MKGSGKTIEIFKSALLRFNYTFRNGKFSFKTKNSTNFLK